MATEMITLPPEISRVLEKVPEIKKPEFSQWFLSDLTVTINTDPHFTDRSRLTYTVKLSPGILDGYVVTPETKYNVEVLVIPRSDQIEYPRLMFHTLSSKGEAVTATVEFSRPIPAFKGQLEYTVIVDPFKKFAERNDGNNFAFAKVPAGV